MASTARSTIQRRRILIQGIVQGVGFRPFVYGLALRWKLTGFVLNDSQGVTIEIEGVAAILDAFQQSLCTELPPLAHINSLSAEVITVHHDSTFVIAHSQAGSRRQALISPDTATCDDCLREIFDTGDRRYLYPFTNCTNCGPRFTIIQDVPYDREKTTMHVFSMCPTCQAEYHDPLNRRFHAQPNACSTCGPHVQLLIWQDHIYDQTEPIIAAAQAIAQGAILAIKGLGGYHLACDALHKETVLRLRQRKHREYKPFALMVPDIETARRLCQVSEAEAALLQARQRPIVLLKQQADNPVASAVSPAYNTLGIMLPYTPLHHILLRTFATMVAKERPPVLVMTSGNVSDEPIAYIDDDARARLSTIAEGMLTHNRAIHMRCDDSITRIVAGGPQIVRRSRGYVPEPISLSFALPVPVLACGAHLKNTFCLGKECRVFVSHHIGDLENLETLTSFQEGIEHFQRLFGITPEAIAYDLHPEYIATKYALASDIEQKIGVQHHHAHIASVMAEHGLQEPVIGIAADGTGYGTDGAVWGCEVMIADLLHFERLAHLAYVPLPGGEQAIHQPWRMTAIYLQQAFGDAFLDLDIPFVHQLDHKKWQILAKMIARGINSPPTSSLGRLFDAVSALLGLRSEVLHEGQAAIELEMLAQSVSLSDSCYPFALDDQQVGQIDVSPMMRAIVDDVRKHIPASHIAYRFHCSIAAMLAASCLVARKRSGLDVVALSGGVFQNRLLLEQLVTHLEENAFRVILNRQVPPNDGGISLGQAAVAATRLSRL